MSTLGNILAGAGRGLGNVGRQRSRRSAVDLMAARFEALGSRQGLEMSQALRSNPNAAIAFADQFGGIDTLYGEMQGEGRKAKLASAVRRGSTPQSVPGIAPPTSAAPGGVDPTRRFEARREPASRQELAALAIEAGQPIAPVLEATGAPRWTNQLDPGDYLNWQEAVAFGVRTNRWNQARAMLRISPSALARPNTSIPSGHYLRGQRTDGAPDVVPLPGPAGNAARLGAKQANLAAEGLDVVRQFRADPEGFIAAMPGEGRLAKERAAQTRIMEAVITGNLASGNSAAAIAASIVRTRPEPAAQ